MNAPNRPSLALCNPVQNSDSKNRIYKSVTEFHIVVKDFQPMKVREIVRMLQDDGWYQANPHISPRIRSLRCSWRNRLANRSKKHSDSYGLRRICQNVKPDAVETRIGQTVTSGK